MTWEQKVEMIQLNNQGKQQEMLTFVEPLLETLDAQAEDMLFNCLEITSENILKNKTFFKKLAEHIEKSDKDFDLRTSIRIEYFKLINNELQSKS